PQEYEWPLPVPDSEVPVNSDYGVKVNYIRTRSNLLVNSIDQISCPNAYDYLIQHGDGTPIVLLSNFDFALRYGVQGTARWTDSSKIYNFGVKDNLK
ncbi:hypothetical protein PFISCL1PPCAC_11111, partial [Pristionchus fissidentatus]